MQYRKIGSTSTLIILVEDEFCDRIVLSKVRIVIRPDISFEIVVKFSDTSVDLSNRGSRAIKLVATTEEFQFQQNNRLYDFYTPVICKTPYRLH